MAEGAPDLGFSADVIAEASRYEGFVLGRVVAQHRGLFRVLTEHSDVHAEVSGKFRFTSASLQDYPAVGDFVMIDRDESDAGNAMIHHVLPRNSVFSRRAAGTAHEVQVVAANIDRVFICMSLNNDFNPRRLERYLAITWNSGAIPVVVLTKSDLCDELDDRLRQTAQLAPGVDVIVTTSMTEDGYTALLGCLGTGQTVAFVGSSGVGKSTLINRLLGADVIATRQIRGDDRGRHATTRRELFAVPTGGAVIDTPGMRELGLDSADLARAFGDIDALSADCKFRDCAHGTEPGCAVRQAIDDGVLPESRLDSYRKLNREAGYEGLNSRQIENLKVTEMYSSHGGRKNARAFIKSREDRDK
ncbi:MAG: ribosome small subunit-dependent GTPase A [Actinomycetes bacterium]